MQQTQSVESDAVLPCRVAGKGRPVLFVHGTAAAVWGDLPLQVAGFARAITYERRGFVPAGAAVPARAAVPPLTRLPPHADDAAELLAAVAGAPALLVGWSIGGVIALEVALRWPQRVAGLVLLEPPLHAKRHPDANLFSGVVGSIVLGVLAGRERGGRRFSRWVFREADGRCSLDHAPRDVREAVARNAAAVCAELSGGTGEHLKLAALAALRVPTVVFAGGRSQAFLRAGAKRAAQAVQGAEYIELADANHLLQLDAAPAIAQSVRRLLQA
jgi:(E)-2-((N-methylformamido)methylene)succinate hydrolase